MYRKRSGVLLTSYTFSLVTTGEHVSTTAGLIRLIRDGCVSGEECCQLVHIQPLKAVIVVISPLSWT